jgi:hypothetical protein
MPAVRAVMRACWLVPVAWSRQASRLARSARAPAQRLLPVGQSGNGGRFGAGHRGGDDAGLAGQQGVGQGGGVLVVIQQPGSGLVLVTVRV